MTPAGTSNELDVQNGWEENTHTYIRHTANDENETKSSGALHWDYSTTIDLTPPARFSDGGGD